MLGLGLCALLDRERLPVETLEVAVVVHDRDLDDGVLAVVEAEADLDEVTGLDTSSGGGTSSSDSGESESPDSSESASPSTSGDAYDCPAVLGED